MTLRFPSSAIAVFAREPVLGRVKTRLAAEIGEEQALWLYRAMADRMCACINTSELAQMQLWVSANPEHPFFRSQCAAQNIHLQQGADLGEKMLVAIEQALQAQRIDSVLVVGTDCPAIDSAYLGTALGALAGGSDVVIGPAEDGGYVLIGMRRPIAELFAGVDWGTSEVLSQTLEKLHSLQLEYQLLAPLWDVDRPEDLARLSELVPALVPAPGDGQEII
jgi:rSAM/selenodomain-associated transferase 1